MGKNLILWVLAVQIVGSKICEHITDHDIQWACIFVAEKLSNTIIVVSLFIWIDRKTHFKSWLMAIFVSFIYVVETIQEVFMIEVKGIRYGELGYYLFGMCAIIMTGLYIKEKWIQRHIRNL